MEPQSTSEDGGAAAYSRSHPPGPSAPPWVVTDERGAVIYFGGEIDGEISWRDVVEIAIEVTASEAFWSITSSESVSLCAPVRVVGGADELRSKLSSFPGFDLKSLEEGLLAEERGEEGLRVVCWSAARDERPGPE